MSQGGILRKLHGWYNQGVELVPTTSRYELTMLPNWFKLFDNRKNLQGKIKTKETFPFLT